MVKLLYLVHIHEADGSHLPRSCARFKDHPVLWLTLGPSRELAKLRLGVPYPKAPINIRLLSKPGRLLLAGRGQTVPLRPTDLAGIGKYLRFYLPHAKCISSHV